MFELLLTHTIPPRKLESRSWLVGDVLPGLSGAAAAGGNGSIYLAGGRQPNGTAINTFRRFNLSSRTWEVLADIPIVISGATLTYWSGKFYLFAGTSTTGASYSRSLYEYDIATNVWKSLPSSPYEARVYHSASVINGIIYFFGGWNGAQLTRGDRYIIASNKWESVNSLPISRHGHSSAVYGNEVYLFGGLTPSGQTLVAGNEFLRYSPSNGTYTNFIKPSPIPSTRCYTPMMQSYNKFYIFGGYTDGNATDSTGDFWEYDPATQRWRQISLTGDLVTKRGAHAAAVENGEFHIINGLPQAGQPARIDHYYID